MSGIGLHSRRVVGIVAQTRVDYRDPAPSLDDLRWVLRRSGLALRRCLLALLLAALGGKPTPRRRSNRDLFL
jgi:hypothetical protein